MPIDSRSRVEDILNVILGNLDQSVLQPPQSRVEALLQRLNEIIGDFDGKIPIHICTSDEYDHDTGMPTIENPDENTFYLVPVGSGDDMYDEWIYSEGNRWERFGSGGRVELPQSDWNQNDSTADDFVKNKPSIRQQADGGILENSATSASGLNSHAEGDGTVANHRVQHVFGEHNIADPSSAASTARGNFIEIVGNGADASNKSNARTLDFSGNEEVAGDVKANACGGVNPVSLVGVNTKLNMLDANVGAITDLDTTDKSSVINAINEINANAVGMNVVTVSGTSPVIVAQSNTQYICGEVLSIDFTPSATGISDVMFTSGSTLAVLTIPQTVKLPDWFEIETNHTYEISVSDGVYGAVASWET